MYADGLQFPSALVDAASGESCWELKVRGRTASSLVGLRFETRHIPPALNQR